MPFLYGRNWSRQELFQHVGDITQIQGAGLMSHEDGAPHGVRL